uniref:(California timema) hypothetical protein n=1 Tax=Timema californicum TaxID=61474 RepID=A0A7R9J4E1_TIMCA|nr:unnamed protein product [Timema californicum]
MPYRKESWINQRAVLRSNRFSCRMVYGATFAVDWTADDGEIEVQILVGGIEGIKLDAQPLTIATASILFHRFFKEADVGGYDVYLIASTTLYLAGKVKDDPLKIRDVINVTHNTLHRGSAPLELGDEYWNMRDAIVQAELLIMRMLKFEVTITHPHKDFHFEPSILDYTPQHIAVACINLALQCYGMQVPYTDEAELLWYSDFHFEPSILDYTPQHIAVACINLALQCYGMQVPYTDEAELLWYSSESLQAFVQDLHKDQLWEIMEKIMEVYDNEPEMA